MMAMCLRMKISASTPPITMQIPNRPTAATRGIGFTDSGSDVPDVVFVGVSIVVAVTLGLRVVMVVVVLGGRVVVVGVGASDREL